jgi:hypothetical protein
MKGRNEMDRSEIWQMMLADAGIRCAVSTARDLDTVTRRVANEGESFFTKILPTFAKDFERSLDEGVIPNRLFYGFQRRPSLVKVTQPSNDGVAVTEEVPGGVPKFLNGFLEIIFDSQWEVTETVYQEAVRIASQGPLPGHNLFPPVIRVPKDAEEEERMAEAIHCVRQLTLLFSKEWALPSEDLIQQACESYVTTDEELDRPFWMVESTDFYSCVGSRQSRRFAI